MDDPSEPDPARRVIAPAVQDYRQAQGVASSEARPTSPLVKRPRAVVVRRNVIGVVGAWTASCVAPSFLGGANTRLVYGAGGSIVEISSDGSGRAVRLQPQTGGIARDPAWSPDRTKIAYAYTPPMVATRDGGVEASLPNTDLYVLDIASGVTQVVHTHEGPGESLERPMWSRDGMALVSSVMAPIFEGGAVRAVRESVVRVTIGETTNARTTIALGVQDVAVSPDGAKMAWVRRVPEGRAVEIANSDGSGVVVVVPPTAVDGAAWPRFSPDGRQLVFSAVSPATPVATVTPLPRRAARWVSVADASALRHGLPMDLFVVNTDGSDLRRVTTVGEDSPQATWSPDGKRFAIVSGGGIYVLPVGTVDLQLIDAGGGHGAIDWR